MFFFKDVSKTVPKKQPVQKVETAKKVTNIKNNQNKENIVVKKVSL